ncbi:MAG: glucose sorbosone dehydrogenase [Pedosphaera sp.]|nr:glucose sorbosone dehydrogenase [Pedosphaera sp.]MSU42619.1 glucose sorbosone dehydrogenase [Pedosphaera sp.]
MKSILSGRAARGVLALCVALSVCSSSAAPLPKLKLANAWPNLKFKRPLWMEQAPDGSGRIFLLEQQGRIVILPKDRQGAEVAEFFDIVSRKTYAQDEEGLLGMAFHPKFKENGKFYVFYSMQDPMRSVVSEFTVAKDNPNKADLASERVLLQIVRPFWNHDGGCIVFGPDGKLYISHGDGGKRDDPLDNAQNPTTLLGCVMRIDVDTRTGVLPYGIPKDNPFVGREDARGEIWANGLRNVWRMSFDRETGQLWAGDVGQDKWEEIDLIVKGGNYGWRAREGFHPWLKTTFVPAQPYIDPVIEYPHVPGLATESKFNKHSHGLSVTGGYVYRGKKHPSLRGLYLYGDYKQGTVWGLRHDGKTVTAYDELIAANPIRLIASFAEDGDGEVYMLGFEGKIFALEPAK